METKTNRNLDGIEVVTIEVHHPLYFANTGKKSVGLAEWRIVLEDAVVQVRITQTYAKGEKAGKLIFPTLYCINKSELSKYPTMLAGDKRTVLRIVPLDDMRPKVFDKKEPQYYPPKPKIEDVSPQIEHKIEPIQERLL